MVVLTRIAANFENSQNTYGNGDGNGDGNGNGSGRGNENENPYCTRTNMSNTGIEFFIYQSRLL